eukprot:3939071-Amphidinium_carterae.1
MSAWRVLVLAAQWWIHVRLDPFCARRGKRKCNTLAWDDESHWFMGQLGASAATRGKRRGRFGRAS